MEENLKIAAQNGDVNMIYTLLREDPYLLDHIDPVPTIHTPLHIGAAFGHSIQDVTIQNEIVLHITVKNHNFDAFDFLPGDLHRAYHEGSDVQERKIINWKDDEGNSVLYIATAMHQPR
ncbi:hypothetical protein FEM48_Zijuj05G0171400 [Ziziphus jujuba var. spinosa]|uniref:Uncharacterized protein n=1 Tax=Ziziphus jujuba var. spinosa TaxID=714518 RepID=A0A978VG26_ZIZJJ|nr:hypothetical protein FEM48_Zijuj05G0171400 [Ziziphus jujuba var. spinosa]